jgi:hypothetical protein
MKKKNQNFTAKNEFDSVGFFWVGRVWANKFIFILALCDLNADVKNFCVVKYTYPLHLITFGYFLNLSMFLLVINYCFRSQNQKN